MNINSISLAAASAAFVSLAFTREVRHESRIVRITDTVYVSQSVDYDRLSAEVQRRLAHQGNPTVIDGDLIVKGRIGVGGAPEPGADYGITVHAPVTASLRFISNESLTDPQRAGNQHRHVGTLSLAQDGGLRLDQNSTCYSDSRGCITDDRMRRRAYSGYDSMGDYAFYLSNVDSLTGSPDAPRAQSLVFRLIGDDGHIHLTAFRATQRIFFNGSTATNASDLQWEVPLAPITPPN